MNELEARFKQWSPQAQAEAAALLDEHLRDPAKIWYCQRGRKCDGRPHDGVPYSHARADQWPPTVPGWFIWLVMSGRGAGKALAVDTPILTRRGWVEMGDVVDGDEVYDEQGQWCRVVQAHPVYRAHTLYRVHFSDGTYLDADDKHQWVTWEHRDRKQFLRNGGDTDFPDNWADKAPITTGQMFTTQRQANIRGDRNHCIPIAKPLAGEPAMLPIDPYAFGAWLGDGSTQAAEFTVSDEDFTEMSLHLANAGAPLSGGRRKPDAKCGTYGMGVTGDSSSLWSRLRALDVLGGKRIPSMYLNAPEGDRLALLCGLMDTDGTVDPRKPVVEFCSTNKHLAEGVLALARSLSERPVLSEGRATLNGVDHGPKYRVTWRPSVHVPFRLTRKASKVKPAGAQGLRLRHRMVTSVEEIPSAWVRCLTVDSPNSMYLAGRALIPTHNTRTGSEYLRKSSKRHARMAGIARRTTDIRATMVEGDSGLIKTCEKAKIGYTWMPSKREFTFDNGSTIYFYSAEEPDSLRGPQHELAWLDEPAHMPLIQDVWDNLVLGLRIGDAPRVLMTSTPLPIPWLKEIIKRPDLVLVRVSTYANLDNLAPAFRNAVLERYEGTRLGRQELYGELVEDVEGALWNAEIINLAKQLPAAFEQDELLAEIPWERVVIGVDPAGTANKKSDATGIVVVGRFRNLFYVLEDATDKYSPDGWAKKVSSLYKKWSADRIVVEKNYGGDMVEANLRNEDEYLPITTVTSRKGKEIRAEPIVGLYEKGKVKHPADLLSLETEMMEWVPGSGPSPNRIDAVVHALTDMMGKSGHASLASAGEQIIPISPMSPIPSFINQTQTGLWVP